MKISTPSKLIPKYETFHDTGGLSFSGLSFRDTQGSGFFGSEFSRHPGDLSFSGLGSEFSRSEFSRHPRLSAIPPLE